MKEQITQAVEAALRQNFGENTPVSTTHQITKPKQESHGDFASNIALTSAATIKLPPRQIAATLLQTLSGNQMFDKVEVAGPGFLNFFLSHKLLRETIRTIHAQGDQYGNSSIGKGKRLLLEFVSANPTGPLHVGHGRGAAVGDSLARILKAAGFEVEKEYYINDVGNQMRTLGSSVYMRYLELLGRQVEFPRDYYQGDYIKDIARNVIDNKKDEFLHVSPEECLPYFTKQAVDVIHSGIVQDLADFDVKFDRWFSEKSLHENGLVAKTIEELIAKGHIYEQDGALWFRTSAFGDEKDRVVKRSNGVLTYFASDMAYHRQKLDRGYDMLIDIWGADHHGYVPRVKAVIKALGLDDKKMQVLLVQFVTLLKNNEPVSMSTRSGEFITLKEVVDEVGKDAARFMFMTRKSDSHLDFDLELVKKQGQENPVYYVQYAHARIASILRTAQQELGVDISAEPDLNLLNTPEDMKALKTLAFFGDVIEESALTLEPHRISYYLTELAGQFHYYYTKNRFLGIESEISLARLWLASAIKQTLEKGLWLLGVSAPEKM